MSTIGFGKFKHRSWEDVVDKDHGYVEWCLEKLDVTRFDIPEHVLQLYLDKFRHDTKAKALVNSWRERKGSEVNVPRYAPASLDEISALPVNSIESTLAFEEACLAAFGKFPFTKWDANHVS